MDAKKIAYYYREHKKLKNLQSIRKNHHYNAKQIIEYSGKRTVVLVIGESLNKYHLSLYGYSRKTNPKLSTIDSLLIFNNIISSATQTRESIIRILSQATIDNEDPYILKGSIITLAKDIGYKTYWISNQMMYGISDTETSVLAKDCDKQWFLNTDWNTNSLDERVIPVFNKILNEPSQKKFIIIHLLGNHFSYSKRYKHTSEFKIIDNFNFPKYLSKDKIYTINEYDKSVKYNDQIVFQLIKDLQKTKGIINFIYFPDHGEDVYDTKRMMLGHGSPLVTKYVIEIPFIVYNNTLFYEKDKRSYKYFTGILNRPYCTVDMFYSIADILWANFSDYRPENSLFSSKYNEKDMIIINSNNKVLKYKDIIKKN
jgi:heptose-I-phosphate ethanolaminephosphotransferase